MFQPIRRHGGRHTAVNTGCIFCVKPSTDVEDTQWAVTCRNCSVITTSRLSESTYSGCNCRCVSFSHEFPILTRYSPLAVASDCCGFYLGGVLLHNVIRNKFCTTVNNRFFVEIDQARLRVLAQPIYLQPFPFILVEVVTITHKEKLHVKLHRKCHCLEENTGLFVCPRTYKEFEKNLTIRYK